MRCFLKVFFGKMANMTLGRGGVWVKPLFKPTPAAGWRVTSEAVALSAPYPQYYLHLSPR